MVLLLKLSLRHRQLQPLRACQGARWMYFSKTNLALPNCLGTHLAESCNRFNKSVPEFTTWLREVFSASTWGKLGSPVKHVVLPIVPVIQGSVDALETLKFIKIQTRRNVSAFNPRYTDCKFRPVAVILSVVVLTSSVEMKTSKRSGIHYFSW